MADAIVRLRVESSEYDQKLSRATQQLQHMEKEVRRTGATFAYADKEEIAFIQSLGSMETKTTSAKSQLREYTEALMQMTSTYRNLTQEEKNSDWGKALAASMDEIKGKAAMLRDAMADVNREIGGMASDTQVFDQIAGGVTGVVSAFQIGQGALQMFGVKSENAVQAIAKLQGAMAVANGLTKVQALLQKESALMIGITTMQKKAAAAAEAIDTAAKEKNIAVTKGAAIAQKALNAVAKANPFLLLAGAIGGVVTALSLFSRKASEADESMRKFRDNVASSMAGMVTNYTLLQNQWEQLTTEQEKNDWITNNADKFKELGVAIESVSDAEKVFRDETDVMIKSFELRARAAALQSLAEERYKEFYGGRQALKEKYGIEEVKSGQAFQNDFSNFRDPLTKNAYSTIWGNRSEYLTSDENGNTVFTQKGAEAFNRALLFGDKKEEADAFLQSITDINKELDGLYENAGIKKEAGNKAVEVPVEPVLPEGSIAKLEKQLSDLQKKKKLATSDEERNGFQQQIEATQKELDKLNGKVEKTAKTIEEEAKPVAGSIAAQRDEVRRLQKDWENAADDDSRNKIKVQLDEANAVLDKMLGKVKEVKIEIRELNPTMNGPERTPLEQMQQSIRIQQADAAALLDENTLKTLLGVALQNGINGLDLDFSHIMDDMREGFDIPDEAWEELAAQINEKLANLGLDPIELDVKTGNVKELDNQIGSLETNLNGAIGVFGQLGDAMQQIDDPGAKVAGIIMEAIANIAGTFAKSLGGTFTPWDWIAAAISGTATMISTIAAIKSATSGGFANGGIIPGNSFSGDNLRTSDYGINAGELILNRAQQGAIAGQLNSNPMGNMRLSTEISGSNLRVVLNNDNRQRGGSRDVYGVH